MNQTAMQLAMAKALRAKEAAVPKADRVNSTKGFRATKNAMEGTGRRPHGDNDGDGKGC